MPANITGTFDAAEMLEYINSTPRPKTFLRESLFGGRMRAARTPYILADFSKGKRHMAPFVSRYSQGVLQEKLPFDRSVYTPPRVAPLQAFTGDEAMDLAPGEVVGDGRDPADRMAEKYVIELDQQDRGITRREEWMCARMLSTGVIPIVGEGVSDEIDLNHTLTDTLSGTACWNSTAANVAGNLLEWQSEIVKQSGITPDRAILGMDAAMALQNNELVIKQMTAPNMRIGSVEFANLPNGAIYLGNLNGIDLFAYPEWYVDDTTKLVTPMIADKVAILFPSAARNPLAQMLYAAWYNVVDHKTYVGPRIPRQWVEEGLNQEFIQVQSFPLPYMPDVDSWLVATVIA